ncbi:hypothetical protein ACOSQ2_019550 [Xanthoceras sorbifolium]
MTLFQHLHEPTNDNSPIWTFLQRFSPLSCWRQELTKLMGYHIVWKMDDHMSSKITCIFIYHRPYMFNPKTKLLWSINNTYEWQTLYDMDLQWLDIRTSLINFLYELNNVEPDELFIVPQSQTPPGYFQDSQDPMEIDTQ